MSGMPDNLVDAIVTDPPYGLSFMGKKWDYDVPGVEIWAECLRVLKPGGYLLSFAGTRTQHRMAVRIEDAGFEIRDMIAWVYGSGFPKSLNIGKSIENKVLTGNASKNGFHKLDGERREGRVGMYDTVEEQGFRKVNPDQLGAFDLEPTTKEAKEWNGWGTALKPALEPITVARKPLSEKTVAENVLKWGTGGINIDASRVESNEDMSDIKAFGSMPVNKSDNKGFSRPWMNDKQSILDKQNAAIDKMKSLGRFPANLIHDGSDEVVSLFPNTKSGGGNKATKNSETFLGTGFGGTDNSVWKSDSGSAARFFYCAKASKRERNAGCEELEGKERVRQELAGEKNNTFSKNSHPTVKPIALMEYLIKLVSREGAVVLDPFAGSGSTLIACKNLNRQYIGIEKEPEYIDIINKRLTQ
jgi:site-specific DNA-methyltransferase (adenine-specific)